MNNSTHKVTKLYILKSVNYIASDHLLPICYIDNQRPTSKPAYMPAMPKNPPCN